MRTLLTTLAFAAHLLSFFACLFGMGCVLAVLAAGVALQLLCGVLDGDWPERWARARPRRRA